MATATAPVNGTPAANDPWMMEVPSGGGDYVCCPAGNHPATIVGLFDIGHQAGSNDKNEPVEKRQLVVVFELAKKRPDGKPFVLGRRYTWSLHEKSTFYKDAVAITGVKFKEGDKFNPRSLSGLPVMVSVTNTASGEKTYHDVAGVAQYPDVFPALDATLHPVCWSVLSGEPFPPGLDWLPFVYGHSIPELADGSREARGRGIKPVPAVVSGDDPDVPY